MRKPVLVAVLSLLLVPHAFADGDRDRDDRHHRHMNASEFITGGAFAAALLGLAGYLVLRRRGVQQR